MVDHPERILGLAARLLGTASPLKKRSVRMGTGI